MVASECALRLRMIAKQNQQDPFFLWFVYVALTIMDLHTYLFQSILLPLLSIPSQLPIALFFISFLLLYFSLSLLLMFIGTVFIIIVYSSCRVSEREELLPEVFSSVLSMTTVIYF